MKKQTIIVIAVIIALLCNGCSHLKDAQTNMQWIEKKISDINKHFSDTASPYFLSEDKEVTAFKGYQLKKNEQEMITVEFLTTQPEGQGELRYILTYDYPPEASPDFELLLYIVNEVAKKPFSIDFCRALLDAPEEEVSIEKRGSLKSRDYTVAKYQDQSFFDVGTLEYYQYSDHAFEHNEGDQELVFSGLVAQ